MKLADIVAALPDLTENQRRDLILDLSFGWAIARHGKRGAFVAIRHYRSEARARNAWSKLALRKGWAILVCPEGYLIDRRDGAPL